MVFLVTLSASERSSGTGKEGFVMGGMGQGEREESRKWWVGKQRVSNENGDSFNCYPFCIFDKYVR